MVQQAAGRLDAMVGVSECLRRYASVYVQDGNGMTGKKEVRDQQKR